MELGIKTYKEFIELYERACDFFDIPKGNRILTIKFVRELFKIEVKQLKKETENIERQIDELMEI